jgi:NADP-dependent 3-hydroxy acid dehydrogenase YdfG
VHNRNSRLKFFASNYSWFVDAVAASETQASIDTIVQFGARYADRLAKRDHDLILVARKQERLAGRASRLKSGKKAVNR